MGSMKSIDESTKVMSNEDAVTQYTWLVELIARDYLRPGLEFDDLKQEAYLGLFDAVSYWRPDAGFSFESVARMRIKNALRNYLHTSGVNEPNTSIDEPLNGVDSVDSMHDVLNDEEAPTQEDEAVRAETIGMVRKAMAKMPSKPRQLLEAYNGVDSQRELSTQTGVPVQTINRRFLAAGDAFACAFQRVKGIA